MKESLEIPNLPQEFELILDGSITPEEILAVREEPADATSITVWRKCIDQSLLVVGVRETATQRLVGVGMLVGNQRHAELVDGTVHSDFRHKGIGKVILSKRIEFAQNEQIKYVGLTYDENKPWLKAYYERYGFKSIGFCMWLSHSIDIN